MKVRQDYVTNSSSSSFIIAKKNLDNDQIEAIRKHYELGKKMNIVNLKWDSPWDIEENDDFITGYTYMDNFDMYDFLNRIDICSDFVTWGEFEFDMDSYEDETNEKSGWRKLLHENSK